MDPSVYQITIDNITIVPPPLFGLFGLYLSAVHNNKHLVCNSTEINV